MISFIFNYRHEIVIAINILIVIAFYLFYITHIKHCKNAKISRRKYRHNAWDNAPDARSWKREL
jgi:hypothetical protein